MEYRIILPLCECGEEVHPGEDHCHVCLTGRPYNPYIWGDEIHDDTPGLQALIDSGGSIPDGKFMLSGGILVVTRMN